MMRKNSLSLAIFYVVAIIVSAIVLYDGNVTALTAFLIIALLYLAAHIPSKNQRYLSLILMVTTNT